jgi:hypothetical protein
VKSQHYFQMSPMVASYGKVALYSSDNRYGLAWMAPYFEESLRFF